MISIISIIKEMGHAILEIVIAQKVHIGNVHISKYSKILKVHCVSICYKEGKRFETTFILNKRTLALAYVASLFGHCPMH